MKKLALAMACLFAVGVAQADDKGGFSQDAAPPPPHKLDDGYRGVEDGRIMTVEQAKTMHDGATVSLRGNLLKRQEMTVISFVIKAAPSPLLSRSPRLTNNT